MPEQAKYMTEHYMVILYSDSMDLFRHKSTMSQSEINKCVYITHNQGDEWVLVSSYNLLIFKTKSNIDSNIDMFNAVCEEIDAREVVMKVAKRFGVSKDDKTFY